MVLGPPPACEAGWPTARQGGENGGVSVQQISYSDGGTDMRVHVAPILAGISPSAPPMCTLPIYDPPVSMPHVMHSESYPSAITPPPMIPSIMITVMVGVVGGVVVWRTEMMAEGTPCPSLPRFCTMAAGASGVARIENS